MTKFTYYNTDNQTKTNSIETLFPNWQGEKEALAVFSPHDDDAIIGAGYAMSAAQANGAAVYVYVMCEGKDVYKRQAQVRYRTGDCLRTRPVCRRDFTSVHS